jgi:hypothetical protein
MYEAKSVLELLNCNYQDLIPDHYVEILKQSALEEAKKTEEP